MPKILSSTVSDSFGNPLRAALFETELCHAILHNSPVTILEKINDVLISYFTRHADYLTENRAKELAASLIRFKLVRAPLTKPAISIILDLLKRPLTGTDAAVNISELFSLYLAVFNHEHFYDPALDSLPEDVVALRQQQAAFTKLVRTKGSNGIFETMIRGRAEVYYSKRHNMFGITDEDHVPEGFRNWHRAEYTPFKYRAKAIITSPVVQTFRQHGVPFIAGPSGTTADCLEALHFLMPKISTSEMHEFLNLLAAAEVAQGHHSMHEIMLPACNIGLLPQLLKTGTNPKIWERIDYSHSYQGFLTSGFKASEAYENLASKYPEYLKTAKPLSLSKPDCKSYDKSMTPAQRKDLIISRLSKAGYDLHSILNTLLDREIIRLADKVDFTLFGPGKHQKLLNLKELIRDPTNFHKLFFVNTNFTGFREDMDNEELLHFTLKKILNHSPSSSQKNNLTIAKILNSSRIFNVNKTNSVINLENFINSLTSSQTSSRFKLI